MKCLRACRGHRRSFSYSRTVSSSAYRLPGVAEALKLIYREYDKNNFLYDSHSTDFTILLNKLSEEQAKKIEASNHMSQQLFLSQPCKLFLMFSFSCSVKLLAISFPPMTQNSILVIDMICSRRIFHGFFCGVVFVVWQEHKNQQYNQQDSQYCKDCCIDQFCSLRWIISASKFTKTSRWKISPMKKITSTPPWYC